MQRTLLPLLRCPHDGSPLRFEGTAESWIETGTLICERDGQRYPIRHGIPYLYVNDADWLPKAREARGWVQLFQDTDGYGRDDGDERWPYYDEQPWIDIAQQFDIALELVRPQMGEWVLDLGAGRGWAAKQFALRGCQVVATDVFADERVGLGRSKALMEQAGVRGSAVLADGEKLPFMDSSFDLIFCSAVLHHATNLVQLLQNTARILRPGGRLVAINEPCIPDAANHAAIMQSPEIARELSYGINETRPRLDEYRAALRQAGLREEALIPWQTYRMQPHDMVSWSEALGILGPDQLAATAEPARWRPLARRTTTEPDKLMRQNWTDHVLREKGGSIVLVATKQRPTFAEGVARTLRRR